MGKEKQCTAEIRAVNQLGEAVANRHCDYKEGDKTPCILEELAAKGYKVTPKSIPCLRGYPDNFPKFPSEN